MSKLDDGGRANCSRSAAGNIDGSGRLGDRPISAQRRFIAGLSVSRALIDMVFARLSAAVGDAADGFGSAEGVVGTCDTRTAASAAATTSTAKDNDSRSEQKSKKQESKRARQRWAILLLQ